MKKKFYSFWGVSQLLVGAMTIGLVSCEKSSELLYDLNSNHREVNRQYYPTEQLRQSNAIKKNDSTHKA